MKSYVTSGHGPHVMSAAQVGFGLYGAFLVDDPSETFKVPDERVFVVSDIDITEQGKLEDPQTGGSTGMAFGREGNTLLVNGRNHPRLTVRSGVTQRWRVVNAAKSRFFDTGTLRADDKGGRRRRSRRPQSVC